jgi:hypothetical protein
MPSSVINSDDGVISGTSGIKTTGGDDGVLEIQNNGTAQAKVTAAGLLQFNSGYGSVATAYGCRAWVNFDGTGTPAIRGSGNVSSITDNNTGDYTVNFTTAMPDANYGVAFATKFRDTTGSAGFVLAEITDKVNIATAMTTTSLRIGTISSSTYYDIPVVTVSIFR